jgi:hypothetical protein
LRLAAGAVVVLDRGADRGLEAVGGRVAADNGDLVRRI